jgi:D-alanyl-D-alanine carboxypeptidase
MKILKLITLVAVMVLSYWALSHLFIYAVPADGAPQSTTVPTTEPSLEGWVKNTQGQFFYVNNIPVTGWQFLEGVSYYFAESGVMHTGFLETDDGTYYFEADGKMVVGNKEIDGTFYSFTSSGQQITLINPWHSRPEDPNLELKKLSSDYASGNTYISAECYDALIAMLDECNRICPTACVASGYRSKEKQEELFAKKVQRVMDSQGVSEEEAAVIAARSVAVPGTSEHQLGLAVDIVDTKYWVLDKKQEEMPAQKWLMENSWRFGFILRFPTGKTSVTGIIYEPWHYRYVGEKVATEIYHSGLTLEEYLQQLTDGTWVSPIPRQEQ